MDYRSKPYNTNHCAEKNKNKMGVGGTKFIFKDWNRLSSLNLGVFRTRRRKMP